jgi:hypothetical protein
MAQDFLWQSHGSFLAHFRKSLISSGPVRVGHHAEAWEVAQDFDCLRFHRRVWASVRIRQVPENRFV